MGVGKMSPGALIADVIYGRKPQETDFDRPVLWAASGNDAVRLLLERREPCLVARLGAVELSTASYCLRWRSGDGPKLPYLQHQRRLMRTNAGFFPTDDASLDRFARLMIDSVAAADALALCFHSYEDRFVQRFCPRAQLLQIDALDAMTYSVPWTSALRGLRVLVVHPFAETIQRQYRERRELLFADPEVLPKFELQTLAPPQTSAGGTSGYADWFAALDSTLQQMRQLEFDVAIVGAGAYGLHLCALAKSMGRMAVHMGGATQLLFGIKGRRWEQPDWADTITRHYNDWWVRPSTSERPPQADRVENGCYW